MSNSTNSYLRKQNDFPSIIFDNDDDDDTAGVEEEDLFEAANSAHTFKPSSVPSLFHSVLHHEMTGTFHDSSSSSSHLKQHSSSDFDVTLRTSAESGVQSTLNMQHVVLDTAALSVQATNSYSPHSRSPPVQNSDPMQMQQMPQELSQQQFMHQQQHQQELHQQLLQIPQTQQHIENSFMAQADPCGPSLPQRPRLSHPQSFPNAALQQSVHPVSSHTGDLAPLEEARRQFSDGSSSSPSTTTRSSSSPSLQQTLSSETPGSPFPILDRPIPGMRKRDSQGNLATPQVHFEMVPNETFALGGVHTQHTVQFHSRSASVPSLPFAPTASSPRAMPSPSAMSPSFFPPTSREAAARKSIRRNHFSSGTHASSPVQPGLASRSSSDLTPEADPDKRKAKLEKNRFDAKLRRIRNTLLTQKFEAEAFALEDMIQYLRSVSQTRPCSYIAPPRNISLHAVAEANHKKAEKLAQVKKGGGGKASDPYRLVSLLLTKYPVPAKRELLASLLGGQDESCTVSSIRRGAAVQLFLDNQVSQLSHLREDSKRAAVLTSLLNHPAVAPGTPMPDPVEAVHVLNDARRRAVQNRVIGFTGVVVEMSKKKKETLRSTWTSDMSETRADGSRVGMQIPPFVAPPGTSAEAMREIIIMREELLRSLQLDSMQQSLVAALAAETQLEHCRLLAMERAALALSSHSWMEYPEIGELVSAFGSVATLEQVDRFEQWSCRNADAIRTLAI